MAVPFLILVFSNQGNSQIKDPEAIRSMIQRHKKDARGPYKDIRWFCKDGTDRPARDPCPDAPGNQHARYKDEVISLSKRQHIFFGQILTSTPFAAFWDESNNFSRLKQYQLEQFLRRTDNQWIHRKAQFYRGAVQSEDESQWGVSFYHWLLSDTSRIQKHYFLIRQSIWDIPHAEDTRNAQLMRSLSKEIADTFPSFQNLRIKIHGFPEATDAQLVQDFYSRNRSRIPGHLVPKFEALTREMKNHYRPFQVSDFSTYQKRLNKESKAAETLQSFLLNYPLWTTPASRCEGISAIALQLRRDLKSDLSSDARLVVMDISVRLESMLIQDIGKWEVTNLKDLLRQIYCLSEAATAFGYLEIWEWDEVQNKLKSPATDSIRLNKWSAHSGYARNMVEWGSSMVRSYYWPVIQLYAPFEPLANGFFDDKIRGSVLLPLGNAVSKLSDAFSQEAGFSNEVMGMASSSGILGLNPGFALGELVVNPTEEELKQLSPEKIYVFHQPPEDLKPVAGIATVTEGNLVSHVQLLARNLGIPNMRLSPEHLEAMKAFHGSRVFYAVSGKGTVIMKPENQMNDSEIELFLKQERSEQKIIVPIDALVLNDPRILNMRDVASIHSGKICGPKAANLGQLKQLFPEHVVEGLVLPFSVFKEHMDQQIPGQGRTYWEMLQGIFQRGEFLRVQGTSETEVELKVLQSLDSLRSYIRAMSFLPSFESDLKQQFVQVLGNSMGNVPVFIRSDTNMEDLKEFTGAGLNLTVFNVLEESKILQGIRDVWASPYTERSYKWRQRYLLQPENVYPSILIIPSVNADYSGVLITKGVTNGNEEDISIAFNRGVGGAVDGQAAESWLLTHEGEDELLVPARALTRLDIPPTGGSVHVAISLDEPILKQENRDALRHLSARIRQGFPIASASESEGPFDVELGFQNNHIWLFQVRPFVENKQAASSSYLLQITPTLEGDRMLSLDMKI